jgi:hypothetical protein
MCCQPSTTAQLVGYCICGAVLARAHTQKHHVLPLLREAQAAHLACPGSALEEVVRMRQQ